MIQKPVEDISELDLEYLIDENIIERKTLEYKEQLIGNTDSEKKKFLATISSFANASGGDLLLGIKEDRNTGGPLGPLEGLEIENFDQERLRLEQIIRDGIEPNIPSSLINISPITLSNSKLVIIIRISKSWLGPHRVSFRNWGKFYLRSSGGKYLMDIQELRSAFIFSESIYEKIKRFREYRIAKLMANETPILFSRNGKIIYHLIPITSFYLGQIYDLEKIRRSYLSPMRASGWNYRYNIDGILSFTSPSEEGEVYSYVQLFRNGIIESVNGSLLMRRENNYIPISAIEIEIINNTPNYLDIFTNLNVNPPIYAFLSILGAKGLTVSTKRFPWKDVYPIDRDILLLPEISIEDYGAKLTEVFKFCFDSLWNSVGFSKSPNYRENGEWNPY